jgi:hypothetical protein
MTDSERTGKDFFEPSFGSELRRRKTYVISQCLASEDDSVSASLAGEATANEAAPDSALERPYHPLR